MHLFRKKAADKLYFEFFASQRPQIPNKPLSIINAIPKLATLHHFK